MTNASGDRTATDEGHGELETVKSPSDDRPTGSGRWAVRGYRVLITMAAAVLFNQSLQAGEFMSGRYEFLEFHRLGAMGAEFLVLLAAIAAGVARYRGRYPLWPAGVTGLLFVVIQLQEWAGEERVLSVHVPLGVSIIVTAIGLTVWAWRES